MKSEKLMLKETDYLSLNNKKLKQ